MGLEGRDGRKGRRVLREGLGLICLLNKAKDWKVEGLLNFCETSVVIEVVNGHFPRSFPGMFAL